eukprot:TRINITY_DN101848_c0_g1_i1.p1 TRINITY_DN101848_c0_g1~~TRINITY_DN101848_c0_g1_i1.p1  ORF type:complete len:567 (-),score=98.99 TRINITY_DN101848_c0_g1_i1:276-1976(-)
MALAAKLSLLFTGGVLGYVRITPECGFQSQPGLEYLGSGVDLTSFLPRVGAASEMKHYVVQLSCDRNLSWTNPYSKTRYAIWDQVESIRGDPSSVRDGFFFKFWDTFSFTEHFKESVSGEALFGIFSASEEFDESFNLAVKLNASLYYDYGKVNAFDVTLSPSAVESDAYLKAVGDLSFDWFLPTKWYEVTNFVGQWGTHYIWQVSLGGQFRYAAACESVYVHTAGEAHAEAQASFDFLFLLAADGGASAAASASETAYQAACVRRVSCIGGDQKNCNMNSTSSWSKYVESVDTIPGPGLTNAKYLFGPDLLASWHPKKYVATAALVAYIAWAGLEKLFAFFELTRAELKRIAALEDPECYVSNVTVEQTPFFGWEVTSATCGTTPWAGSSGQPDIRANACATKGPSGDPLSAVRNARAWANRLLKQTDPHNLEMSTALAAASSSRKVDSWLHRVEDWLVSFKDMTEKAYSFPTLYTCAGSYDSLPGYCCDTCCTHPGASCNGALQDTGFKTMLEQTAGVNSTLGNSCNKKCPAKLPNCQAHVLLPSGMTVAPPPSEEQEPMVTFV